MLHTRLPRQRKHHHSPWGTPFPRSSLHPFSQARPCPETEARQQGPIGMPRQKHPHLIHISSNPSMSCTSLHHNRYFTRAGARTCHVYLASEDLPMLQALDKMMQTVFSCRHHLWHARTSAAVHS